jgi:trimeric autotransporter adhesin
MLAGNPIRPACTPARGIRLRLALIGVLVVGAAPALAWAVGLVLLGPTAVSTSRAHGDRLQSLPVAAQGPISAALGSDRPAYRVRGLRAANPAQHLRVLFARRGVSVRSGGAGVTMALLALGHGELLRPLGAVVPRVSGNRVGYPYGSLTEWFANGPLGLEQGFALAARPRGGSGPLTLSLMLSGDLHPRLQHGSLLLTGDGVSLGYDGLVAMDARGRTLPSWLQMLGDRVLIRVDDRGAAYPVRIDPFIQQAELSARHGVRGEEFGESVAISGKTIVVGTPNYTVASTNREQGAAYVFTMPSSGWANAVQTAVLKATRGQAEELFGHSVAVSGDTIVVGAPFREVGEHTGQGAAYLFVKPRSGWRNATQTAKLTATRGVSHEFFGEAVAVSGSTIICGAPGSKVASNAMQGAVDVFSKPASGWAGSLTPKQQLTASDGEAHDAFGIAVAISGETIVAGADLHAVGKNAGQGAVYVFVEPASGWKTATQTAELTDATGEAGELLGHSVAISGTTIVAGAPYRTVGKNPMQGMVDVFTGPATGWAGTLSDGTELTVADGAAHEALGRTLAISGTAIVAGADFREVGKNAEQGAAYVFLRSSSGWATATQTGELVAANGAAGDDFGRSVAISGETIVVGAPDHEVAKDLGQGAVYTLAVASSATGAGEDR